MDRQRSQYPLIAEEDEDANPSSGVQYDEEAGPLPEYWRVPHAQLSLNPLYGDEGTQPGARASAGQEEEHDLFEPTLAEKQAAAASAVAQSTSKQPAAKREGMRISLKVTCFAITFAVLALKPRRA